MSTSLAEQLRRLAAPQTSILVDSKKRASILFDPKEAANKDRQTIFDLGHSGLIELIEINPVFMQFEKTLFDIASVKLERAVETANVNKLIDKNIKKFFYHLSPYFMLQPAHLCLEWLIRRFHIHLYNKSDLIGLILPYHETKVFVKCVQLLDLKNPNDQWKWLEPIQKPGVSLSKTAILNRAASDTSFLKFVCDYTKNAIKELDIKANTLQTQINFYYTTVIGGLEYARKVTESHILSILPSILKGLISTRTIDFTAGALMITMQLCCRTKLTRKILDTLIGKITFINYQTMQQDIILALIVIYQRQSEILEEFPEEYLVNFITKKWITMTIAQLSIDSVKVSAICCPLVSSCLKVVQAKKDGWNECKNFLESLLNEIQFKDEDVNNLIRTVLDSFQRTESRKKISENEIIEIDSDNDETMNESDIQIWYSQYLQELEKQYPIQFDDIIKQVMQDDSGTSKSRKQALRTVLSFRLKSSYFKDNTTIYESLYHNNARNRTEGVKFLVDNFHKLKLSDDLLLKESLKDRLNDSEENVVAEILKLSTNDLLKLFNNEELVKILIEILCKNQTLSKWNKPIPLALNYLTQKCVYNGTDLNRIFLAIIPFMIIVNNDEMKYLKIIYESDFAKELPILRTIVTKTNKLKTVNEISGEVIKILCNTNELSTIDELLKSFPEAIDYEKFIKLFNFSYFLLLLEASYKKETKLNNILDIINILTKINDNKIRLEIPRNDEDWLRIIRRNRIPINIYVNLLKTVIKNTKFNDDLKKIFNIKSQLNQIYLKIYDCLLTNAFEKEPNQGKKEYENAVKEILQYRFESAEEKLQFLSNFFIVDRHNENTKDETLCKIKPELQIRSLRLFHLVVIGSDKNYKIDGILFTKILLGLSSKIQAIREYTLKILQTLIEIEYKNDDKDNGLNNKLKVIVFRILEHSEEIKINDEHLSLILSLIMSSDKKQSIKNKNIKCEENECISFTLNQLIDIICDNSVEIYIKTELLENLKLITSTKIFKRILKVGLEILQSYETKILNNNENCILNISESKIFELITLRYDESTIKLLIDESMAWEFIEKSFKLHKLLLINNDGKIISITSSILDIFDEQTYNQMPEKFKIKYFELFIEAVTFNNLDNMLITNAKKFIRRIQLNCLHIQDILENMKNISTLSPSSSSSSSSSNNKKLIKNIAPDPQILNSKEWKCGITLLEFLQNKKKLDNYKILIPILFDILKECVYYEEQFTLEYAKQLILSCLLLLCQKLIEKSSFKQNELPENTFKIDLIVQCIRGTQNSQTHHHALLLLSHCATIVPQQVLDNMMSIFTFMGSSVVRHDDAFSFQIISNIIESVIPTLIRANSKKSQNHGEQEYDDELVISVLKVFADIILDVPEHRRLPLYTKLIRTLGAMKYLWMFLCVLFESHVKHSEKKKKESSSTSLTVSSSKFIGSNSSKTEELPKRLEIALQIMKDFEPSITIETCTSLFAYLKKLPIDKIDDDDDNNMEIDITDSTLFNVDTNTSKQLRHYKYVILQFINSFLISVDFINQIALLEDNETITMKPYYQNFIIKILSYIPDIIQAMEKQTDNNQMKFWKVILHHCYNILDSAISLLSPDMLLIVIYGLMQHQLPAVRRKVIDILIDKLQYKADYFENCNEENMLKLLEPLQEICDSILSKDKFIENATTNEIIYIQQTALIALKILSKLLSIKYPEYFKDILFKLTKIIKKHKNISRILLATVVLSITEISSNLRAHSIVHLPKFMPLLIELLDEQSEILNNQLPDNVCISIITGIQKLFEVLPLFLGPYIVDILVSLTKIWLKCLKYQNDSKTNVIITKLTLIWTKISNIIPLRILIPNCDKAYLKLLEDEEYFGVSYIMKLLKESLENASGNDIQAMQIELTTLFLNAFEFRAQYIDKIDITSTEESIIQAFVSLTLKLSESSFRPLYHKFYDWALRETVSKERTITYFFLSSRIAEALQSLFVLFANDLIQHAAGLLDKCNSVKSDKLYFEKSDNKNVTLIEYILRTLFFIFLHDSKGFVNAHRFDILMQPIVDQLENPLILSNKILQELLISTLSQLAVAVSNDSLWKQLNYQILLKTRNNNPDIRILSFQCCVDIARKIGEDFNPLLPETIPFIAELFEDEIERVEKSCKKGVQELEKILGESLQKYF